MMIEHVSDIPSEIDNYHSLYLLETLAIHQKLPLPSSTYKATHISTGIKYCLRRLHGTKRKTKTKNIHFWKRYIDLLMFDVFVHFLVLSMPSVLLLLLLLSLLRFSITVHQMHGRRRSVEKVPTFKCCPTKRSVHHQKFWRSM